MPALQIIALDTTTPQLRAPASGDTYSAPRALDITPETLTGSSATSSLSIAQTWNTTGTPTALQLNLTDTASNAASLLMDLRRGGASQFNVRKDGSVTARGSVSLDTGGAGNIDVAMAVTGGTVGLNLSSTNGIGWTSSEQAFGIPDLVLRRDAANTLAQRNGVNAQAFRVYNTFTDASNYERGFVRWNANSFQIGCENAGTGVARGVVLSSADHLDLQSAAARNVRIAPAGTTSWVFNSSGHLIAGTDNTSDIGAGGGNRPRYLYLGGGSLTGSQADSSLVISPTWNTTGTPTAIDLNVTDTASNASSLLMNLRVGGSSAFRVAKTGSAVASNSYILQVSATDTNRTAVINATGYATRSGGIYSWGAGASDAGGAPDLVLARDAANTLALRNGVNAQAFRVYNSFTDASNGEWLGIRWSSNDMLIGVQANGTGSTNRQMHFGASSYRFFVGSAANATSWYINADGSFTYEGTGSGFIALREQTAPAAPAADRVRIYAEDNGSGKTRLMALFATGAAQQIAIEP